MTLCSNVVQIFVVFMKQIVSISVLTDRDMNDREQIQNLHI